MRRLRLPPLRVLLLLPLLLVAAASGCATRYSTPSRALGTSVSVLPDWDPADRVLRVEVAAGAYPVRRVRLVDARGRELPADAAVQEPAEVVGGLRLGGGLGTGFGHGGGTKFGVGTGVGLGRTVGGRVVPGDVVARFLDPPLAAQPWTLRVTTGGGGVGGPAVTTDVLLAEPLDPEAWTLDPDTPAPLELVTGETRAFTRSVGADGRFRYEPVERRDF